MGASTASFLQGHLAGHRPSSLQYGVRYDIPHMTPAPTYNPCVAAALARLATSARAACRRRPATEQRAVGGYGIANTDRISGGVLQPRLSFNFRLATRAHDAPGGGIGLFISNTPGVWLANPYSNNGVAATTYDVNRLRWTPDDPAFSGDPNHQNVPGGAVTTLARPLADERGPVDKNFQPPTVTKYTLGFDHELPWMGLVATADYGASRTSTRLSGTRTQPRCLTGTLPDGRFSYAKN